MSSRVASSSARVHQRWFTIPSAVCIAATFPSGRAWAGTRPR